jgi:hypothetical protein
MEMISWTYYVKNAEVLDRFKEERNILHTIKRRKVNWIGLILHRNCLLIHVTEGKMEWTGRGGSRHHQTLDDSKETRRTGS